MFLGIRKTRCRKVRGMISDYIDDLLGVEERSTVERHLEKCRACSNELESLRMTVQLLRRTPLVPVPRSFAIREVEAGREEVSEHHGFGLLRPIPAFAIGRINTVWEGVCDPQSLRWLRPATAFATAALVLLLMLDFLQVVPQQGGIDTREVFNESPAQVVLTPVPEEGEGTLGVSDELLVEEPSVPAPPPQAAEAEGKAPAADVDYDEVIGGEDYGGGEEIASDTEGGWPMRQIEIVIGAVASILIAVTVVTWMRRNRLSKV
jgi:hypothetical protein